MKTVYWKNYIEAFGPPGVGKTTIKNELIKQARLDDSLSFSLLSSTDIQKSITDMYRATMLLEGKESRLFPKSTEKLINRAYIKLRRLALRERKEDFQLFIQNVYPDGITDKMEARIAEACLYQRVIDRTGRTNWIISDQSILHRGLMYASRQADPESYLKRFVEFCPKPAIALYCNAPIDRILYHLTVRNNDRRDSHSNSAELTLTYADILYTLLKKEGVKVIKVFTGFSPQENSRMILNCVINLLGKRNQLVCS